MPRKEFLETVPVQKLGRNAFDLSYSHKTTCNAGICVPVAVIDVLPGDKLNIAHQGLVRLEPTLAPMMQRVDVFYHSFFCPNRLVFPEWENAYTQTPVDGVVPAMPYMEYDEGWTPGQLQQAAWMGLPSPITGANPELISPIPFACVQKIWNDYFRDQSLQADLTLDPGFEILPGLNTANTVWLDQRRRAWTRDYFTACLPEAQKGTAIELPLGNFKDVYVLRDQAATPTFTRLHPDQGIDPLLIANTLSADIEGDALYAKTSDLVAQAASIADVRVAIAAQHFAENLARGGSRYDEVLRSQFQVTPADSRLQKPEYIGGSKTPVVISEVLNTTGTEDAPQGNMAGHGVSVQDGERFTYYAQEHGYMITIMTIMPKAAYYQGIPRHWSRKDAFDYYMPEFAHIGEQAVLNKEIFAFQGATGEEEFGYEPRYTEYKLNQDLISGQMRSSYFFWTMTRKFETPPALNAQFIACNPSYDAFAVTDPTVDHFICHVHNDIKAVRSIPVFSVPGLNRV